MGISDVDVLGQAPHIRVDPLHHRLELLHRPHLVELRDPCGDHGSDAGVPQHSVRQLVAEQRDDLFGVSTHSNHLSSDVHVDIAPGRLHLRQRLLQSDLQRRPGRAHQRRVEGARGLQDLRLQGAALVGELLESVDGRRLARAGQALREELVGDLADLASRLRAGVLAELAELLLVDAGDREHGLRRVFCCLRHEFRALLHQLQPCLKVPDARHRERRVLTQRQPGDRPWRRHGFRVTLSEPLCGCQAGDEDRRLRVLGLLQQRLRTLEADLQEVEAEDLPGGGEHLLDLGLLLRCGQHVDILRPLAGEQQSHRRPRQPRLGSAQRCRPGIGI
mmetsp:Transcript_148570/g.370207  ORF Transcript_148570/g.370207 Transcript_148570/m.370207 type:complete len:333 (+) Transcript_148570:3-1001(+)